MGRPVLRLPLALAAAEDDALLREMEQRERAQSAIGMGLFSKRRVDTMRLWQAQPARSLGTGNAMR
jgi:hypothetical protein